MGLITALSLIFGLTILYSITKAAQDITTDRFEESVFKNLNSYYWNKGLSWMNKWKLNGIGAIVIHKGKRKERFFLSSTLLVCLTDFWPLAETIKNICTVSAITTGFFFPDLWPYSGTPEIIIFFAFLYLTKIFTFHIFYHYIFKIK